MGLINDLVKQSHETAKSKGWWEKPKSDLEVSMLIVSEISEGVEEVRNGKPDAYYNTPEGIHPHDPGTGCLMRNGVLFKPEGNGIEMVDALIRIFDYAGYKGWDLENLLAVKMEYNKSRPYRHGGKTA